MTPIQTGLITVTGILAVAWLTSRIFRTRPAAQDLIWRTALVAVAVSPAIVFLRGSLTERQWSLPMLPISLAMAPANETIASAKSDASVASSRAVEPNLPDSKSFPIRLPAQRSDRSDVLQNMADHRELERSPTKSFVPEPQSITKTDEIKGPTDLRHRSIWLELFGGLWLLGTCLRAVQIGIAVRNANRILAGAQPVVDKALLNLNTWCANQAGLRHAAELSSTTHVTGPIVAGLFQPKIVIPATLLSDESRRELKAVLLHENGHLRRRDLEFDLLLKMVAAVLWWHPLVYVMASELRRLREEICDNYVLAHEPAVSYAEMLLRSSVGQRLSETMLIGLGIFARLHRLESRVDALLAPTRSLETKANRATRWVVHSATCLTIIGSIFVRFDKVSADPTNSAQLAKSNAQHVEVSAPSSAKPNDTSGNSHDDQEPISRIQNDDVVETFNPSTIARKPAAQADTGWLNLVFNALGFGIAGGDGPPALSREYSIQIVDSSRMPVANAKVTPWGISSSDGSGFGFEETWATETSDADGNVKILLPEQLYRLINGVGENGQRVGLRQIAMRVDHPEHPIWSDYLSIANVDGIPKVALADSTTIVVRARRTNETEFASRLRPRLFGSYSTDWSQQDGVLTYRRVDLSSPKASHWLRIFQVPVQGPSWFSDRIDLKHIAGNHIELDVVLKPGVRVEGQIDRQVPRPVKDGRVIAAVIQHDPKGSDRSSWHAAADVTSEGTFVLESLPANENLQIIVLCDGWVSRPLIGAELKAYAVKYGFPGPLTGVGGAGDVTPQLLRLNNETVKADVSMVKTAACEVTVVDQDGKPIADANVIFQPHHSFHEWGSFFLGEGHDDATLIREELASDGSQRQPAPSEKRRVYVAKTNAIGVAVVTGIPAAGDDPEAIRRALFLVAHEKYVAMPNRENREMDRETRGQAHWQSAVLSSGETTRSKVQMIPLSKLPIPGDPQNMLDDDLQRPSYAVGASPSTRKMSENAISVRVIDDVGQPIEGVQILLENDDRLKLRTDKSGRFQQKFDDQQFSKDDSDCIVSVRFVKSGYAPHGQRMRFGAGEIVVTLQTRTYFEGTVRGIDGQPAPNVSVRANREVVEGYGILIDGEWTETRTDAKGHYKLLVQPGNYVINAGDSTQATAWIPKWDRNSGGNEPSFAKRQNPTDHPRLSINLNETKPLDIQLERGVEFRARVIDRATGQPLAKFEFQQFDFPGATKIQNEPGMIVVPSVLPGELTVHVFTQDHVRFRSDDVSKQWKASIIGANGTKAPMVSVQLGMTFDLKPGMDAVTIEMEPAIKVSGIVLDPDGKPVRAEVALIRSPEIDATSRQYDFVQHTDQEGRFSILVPPAERNSLRLMAVDRLNAGHRKWSSGVSSILEAKPGDSTESIELKLTRPGSVRGRVVDKRGNPVAAVYVQSSAADIPENASANPSTTSDRNGKFELQFVRPGRHRLHGRSGVTEVSTTNSFSEFEVKPDQTTEVGDVVIPVED